MEASGANTVRFGQWLADEMARRGSMTPAELAREIGVVERNVEEWLSGQARPAPDECRRIGECFGWSETDVIRRCGDPSGQG